MKTQKIRSVVVTLAALAVFAVAANAQSKKCTPIGGMILTDYAVWDPNSTFGYATGDLKGSVGVSILSTQKSGSDLTLNVQHHWVSESGDVISLDPATAYTTEVAPYVYAVVNYQFHINGNGTGKFAGVSGDGSAIGEADLGNGRLVFRYTGTLCTK